MAAGNFLFTSESVTEGHPDKLSDQISDAVLDAVLKKDPNGRVACETFVTVGLVIVGGEITTNSYVDINNLVRGVIKDIGYTERKYGKYRYKLNHRLPPWESGETADTVRKLEIIRKVR